MRSLAYSVVPAKCYCFGRGICPMYLYCPVLHFPYMMKPCLCQDIQIFLFNFFLRKLSLFHRKQIHVKVPDVTGKIFHSFRCMYNDFYIFFLISFLFTNVSRREVSAASSIFLKHSILHHLYRFFYCPAHRERILSRI